MRLFPLAAALVLLVAGVHSVGGAISEKNPLAQEQREVDALLAKADSVELRKLSPRVLQLAERLLKERGDEAAWPYLEKGLEGNSWALDQQLTLGELLARHGRPDALRDKAGMVLRVGEEPEVLERAARLLDRPMPPASPFAEIREPDTVLVLVPMGTVSPVVLRDLCDALSKRLGIAVRLASLEISLPKADRTARQQWIKRTREQLLKQAAEQISLEAQLRRMGFSLERLRKEDEAVVALVRRNTELRDGAAAVETLDAMLRKLDADRQWDVEKMIDALQTSVAGRAGAKLMVLGVTSCDLFGGTSNFLFGAGATGRYLGVVSEARFRAAFNDEAPKRERLIDRLLKQSLSTLGFMMGSPRCNTPECARAYPQSLSEHDQKPSTLCRECRAAFELKIGKPLPAN